MKTTTRAAFRELSNIAMITFLFSSASYSQGVVIKEKVMIMLTQGRKDQPKLSKLSMDYPSCIPVPEGYGTCGVDATWHVYIPVWYGDEQYINDLGFCCDTAPDDGWDVCFDDRASNTIDITEGAEYVKVFKLAGDWSLGANVGSHWISKPWTPEQGSHYVIYFDQREPDTTAWVTLTVTPNYWYYVPGQLTFIVVRPQFSLSASSAEEIRYGEQADIFAGAQNQCGGTNPGLPNTVTYTLSIESGKQYGVLMNTLTGDTGSTLQGLPHDQGFLGSVAFIANGITPDDVVEVRIKVNTSDSRIQPAELSIKINPGCLAITVAPDKMAPGDTVNIILENKLPNGTRVPYPDDQLFNVWMNTDEQYGRLRCVSNNDEGSYVYGQQPFEFIAADNIDVDSIVVAIEASISTGGGGTASSIGVGTKDTVHMPAGLMLKMQASNSKIRITDSIRAAVMERNTARSYEKLRKRLNAMKEKAKNKSQFDKIIAKMESRLVGTNGMTKNSIVSTKSLAKAGQIAMSVEDGESCELPIANATIKNIKLVVYPLEGDDNTQKITGENPPLMPKPVIKAQLKNFTGGNVEFTWDLTIKWTGRTGTDGKEWKTPRDVTELYNGDALGNNSDITDLNIAPILIKYGMRGGAEITLKNVKATAGGTGGGKIYTTADIQNPFIIQGLNPSRATLYTALGGDIYAAVAWQESSFRQFGSSPGFPLQGGDLNDFGVMGIRYPSSDDLIWNWLSNVQWGVNYFNQQMDKAKNYHKINHFSKYDPAPTPLSNDINSNDKNKNQVFLEAYCIYNTGRGRQDDCARYWDWVEGDTKKGDPGNWIENKTNWKEPVGHANGVWNWFISKPWNN